MDSVADTSVPLPPGADAVLSADSPRLAELRTAYGSLDWPCRSISTWWDADEVARVELQWFRGDNPFVWHYRELPAITRLKYLLYAQFVRTRDRSDLLSRLEEDGAFGCWSFEFPGMGRLSRDLLDSVNELCYLDRHLSILSPDAGPWRILDVGAGYGRFAHRAARAIPELERYVCADAIPESTFLCEYYTKYREVSPPVSVLELPGVPELEGSFDLAINIHSFSECTSASVEWWLEQIARLRVPYLFVIPNEPEGFLTREPDDSRRDYGRLIEAAGYEVIAEEPAIADASVSSALEIEDRHVLFQLRR